MPIELSSGFFEAVHWYLPLTWVVRAFRATLFGAYDNAWFGAWAIVVAVGVGAMVVSVLAARWKTVPDAAYRPAIEP
jgi:putative membrane protein